MAKPNLTRAAIERALREAPTNAERYAFDGQVPGFGLRVRGGKGTYIFQYQAKGRTRRLKVGEVSGLTLEQARDIARVHYATVKAGRDPAEEKREENRRKLTLGELAGLYLADLEERARSGAKRGRRSTLAEWRRLYERTIRQSLGSRAVANLDEARVSAWHRSLSGRPAEANRAATLLSAMLGFGERRGLASGPNPCRRLVRTEEHPRQERLSLAEVERLGVALRESEAAGTLHPSAALALRLLLLCGLRRGEVLGHMHSKRRAEGGGLRWCDVDLEAGLLHLRGTKAGDRYVPLGRAAVEALRLARPADADPSAPVCPGALPGAPFVGFEKATRALFTTAGIAWRGTHAFRRTFASIAGEQGLGEYIVGGLLGHRGGSVTSRYVAPDADPLRVAAEAVSRKIAAALNGREPARVLAFEPERRA